MSVTILSDVIAPNSIWSAGVTGKQQRLNARGQNQGGHKQINIVRARTVRQYDFSTVPLTVSIWQTLEGLHEATEGGAYGFLVKDPKDVKATHAEGVATLISAGAHTYQLWKRYTSIGSSRTKDRKITRPLATGFELRVSGVVEPSYSLNVDTGVITIASDPSASSITWSGYFYVPVHFDSDDIEWDLQIAGPEDTRFLAGQRVVLTEVLE